MMKLSNLAVWVLQIAVVAGAAAGCAGYATKGTMMERIENKAHVGMSEEDFTKSVPNSQIVQEQGNRKVYAVAVEEPCFICGSRRAFMRSYEIYATEFTFEDGRLVSRERIVSGK